jgi:hypothetical protein
MMSLPSRQSITLATAAKKARPLTRGWRQSE